MSIRLNFIQAFDEVTQLGSADKSKEDKKTENLKNGGRETDMRERADEPFAQSGMGSEERDAKTIITRDTQIDGSVTTKGSLDVDGVIIGNVSCEKSITIRGKVEGDISADDINMQSSDIKGNITVKSSAVMQKNSGIVGDLNAKTAEINGSVEGNIKAGESLVILSEAKISGDISTAVLEVSKGAVINGKVTIDTKAQIKTPVIQPAAPENKPRDSQSK
jgi:cytoskeletal protein CcmA (bactofilin family)